MEIRSIEQQKKRVETGVIQFGDDWPGIFLRGDSAFGMAMVLDSFLADPSSPLTRAAVEGLSGLLKSCDLRNESVDR